MEIDGITIEYKGLVCPGCAHVFATESVTSIPDMTVETPVEADLHRILPSAEVRGTMVAVCPKCIYAAWTSSFVAIEGAADALPKARPIEPSKKFAHAILTSRNAGEKGINRAQLAMSGYWCVRESNGEDVERWLKLAVQEFVAALNDTDWFDNRDRFYYLLAETYRLLGDFKNAIQVLERLDARLALLPAGLVQQQLSLARQKIAQPVLLNPEFMRSVFFPHDWEYMARTDDEIFTVALD